jgi:transglutaminase-like putative cysteine protease
LFAARGLAGAGFVFFNDLMRIRISHETRYRYDKPTHGVIQTLRLTPSNHEGQYVVRWRIDVSEDSRLDVHEDAFGNITHTFSADGPFDDLTVQVEGEVDTQDMGGIMRGAIERFPPSLYLRPTPLTEVDGAITDFARETQQQTNDTLPLLHALLGRIHTEMVYDTNPTLSTTTAAEAFALKRGVCQDLTHIFIAAARHLDIPARYVGGYFRRIDGIVDQEAGHAWAEAYVPSIGWIAFDPANGICATDAHVRIAVGLDYLGASPVRGARRGGGTESLEVKVRVSQSQWQVQS